MSNASAERLTDPEQWFSCWMPYCFMKVDVSGRRHVYLPVNREYKPLGITSSDWVDYEDYLSQAVVFSSNPQSFEGIWHEQDDDGDALYLYAPDGPSRVDYFARLERLMSRSIKLFEAQ